MSDPFRPYEPHELGPDGYPPEWHAAIKHAVREQAGYRCVRCQHPYRPGACSPKGEWSPCDERCVHHGPLLCRVYGEVAWIDELPATQPPSSYGLGEAGVSIEARWRILTVHHLDGDKANCRWWNVVALCQRCHLGIQGRVQMARVWPWEHSEWFRPYVAGFYAWSYLGEDLSRVQVAERLDDLLGLERVA